MARATHPTQGTTPPASSDARSLLRRRWRAQELDQRGTGTSRRIEDVATLDLGVPDTGTDGGAWALENRGAHVPRGGEVEHGLALAWTLRGAPHLYRRGDLAAVARATAPFSEADARSRVVSAARPLRDAGVPVLDALRTVALELRDIVTEPLPKGEVSTRLTRRLDAPFLRWCERCGATHVFELLFRIPALHAGLELVPGTSPPVLQPVPGWHHEPYAGPTGAEARPTVPDVDVVVAFRRLCPGAPAEPSSATALERAEQHDAPAGDLRLLGPFDPYLQLRDRELLIPDPRLRSATWPSLGRPGAVVLDGELVALWRPRATARSIEVRLLEPGPATSRLRARIEEEGERLAVHRGLAFGGIVEE